MATDGMLCSAPQDGYALPAPLQQIFKTDSVESVGSVESVEPVKSVESVKSVKFIRCGDHARMAPS